MLASIYRGLYQPVEKCHRGIFQPRQVRSEAPHGSQNNDFRRSTQRLSTGRHFGIASMRCRSLLSKSTGCYDLMHDHHDFRRTAPAGIPRKRSVGGASIGATEHVAQGDPAAESLLRRQAFADSAAALRSADGPFQARSTSSSNCRSRSRTNCSALRTRAIWPPISLFPRTATRGFIRPRARAAGRWSCSTRPRIGPGGSIAGNSCSTRPSWRAGRCVFMAFSFGPFVGFWSALRRGLRPRLPGRARRRFEHVGAVGAIAPQPGHAVFCTPSYALHLAEVAAENHIDVGDLDVTQLILAGEPGGSIPEIRGRIEKAWQARVDRSRRRHRSRALGLRRSATARGCTSTRTTSSPSSCRSKPARPAGEGELAELVLTNLGRVGSPVIRYRTGDLVRPTLAARAGRIASCFCRAACSAGPTT